MRIFKITNKSGKDSWGVDWKDESRDKRMRMIIGTKKEAVGVMAKIRTDIFQKGYFEMKAFTDKNFELAAEEYIAHAKKEKNSIKDDVRVLRKFGDFKAVSTAGRQVRELMLSEITVKVVEDYKSFFSEGREKATVNRALAVLKHFFFCCIKWKYVEDNPVCSVKMYKVDNARQRFLELNEIEALLSACDNCDAKAKYLKSIVLIALNTGMRRGEIMTLKWENIDIPRKIIYTGITKNGEKQTKQMNEELVGVFKSLTPLRAQGDKYFFNTYIFTNKEGKQIIDIKKSFKSALKRAGLTGVTFHTLRHTFASHLIMKTGNIMLVKKSLGQKCVAMAERYSHLSPDFKNTAIEDLYKKIDGRNPADLLGEKNICGDGI